MAVTTLVWLFQVDLRLEAERSIDHYAEIFGYFQDSPWVPETAMATRLVNHYPCCPEPYPSLTFTIGFSRRASLYHAVFVGPAVLLALLGSLILLLPHKTGERTFLGEY